MKILNPETQVKWKDPCSRLWKGPDPVLIWGRGHVCVFSQEENEARWLPEHLVRSVELRKVSSNDISYKETRMKVAQLVFLRFCHWFNANSEETEFRAVLLLALLVPLEKYLISPNSCAVLAKSFTAAK